MESTPKENEYRLGRRPGDQGPHIPSEGEPATKSCTVDAPSKQLAEALDTPEMDDSAVNSSSSSSSLKRKFAEVADSAATPPNKAPSNPTTVYPPLPSKEQPLPEDAPVQTWPRFLIIQSNSPTKLTDVSIFMFYEALKIIIKGIPKQITRLASGDLLVELKEFIHAERLLRTTMIDHYPVRIFPHKSLNSCKGLVKCSAMNPSSQEEIIEFLHPQGVTGVKRLTTRKDNKEIKTNSYILNFATPEPPIDIRVAYLVCRVIPFYPNPLRCYNCQIFGHHKEKCRRTAVCGKCAKPVHEGDCEHPPMCVNCEAHKLKSNHPSFSKECPRWEFEKEVVSTRIKYKMSFPEARKVVEARYPSRCGGKSAASVVKGGVTKVSRTIATQYSIDDFQKPNSETSESKNITNPSSKIANSEVADKPKPTPTSPKKNTKPASPKKSPTKPKNPKQTKISFSQTPSTSSSNQNESPASQPTWQTAGKKGAKAQKQNQKKRTGRDPKSARDAIISKNRYGVLPEEGDMDVDHGQPTSPASSATKSPPRPPDSQRVDQADGPDWWKYKETGYPPDSDAEPRPDPIENMDSDPPDTENKNTGKNTKHKNGVTDPVKIDRKK
jgi:hypothetical protein